MENECQEIWRSNGLGAEFEKTTWTLWAFGNTTGAWRIIGNFNMATNLLIGFRTS